MKMQKSTMILSGVLGFVSVGSILMFANPGMQEALTSNIFGSRVKPYYYATPKQPVTINKISSGSQNQNTKPSISGEVVIKPNAAKGKYEGFMNGRLFISTENITKEAAYSNCTQNSSNNMKSSIRCTWNSIEIFSRPTPTKPSISGEVVIRPSTSTTATGILTTSPSNLYKTSSIVFVNESPALGEIEVGKPTKLLTYNILNTSGIDIRVLSQNIGIKRSNSGTIDNFVFEVYKDGALLNTKSGRIGDLNNFIIKKGTSAKISISVTAHNYYGKVYDGTLQLTLDGFEEENADGRGHRTSHFVDKKSSQVKVVETPAITVTISDGKNPYITYKVYDITESKSMDYCAKLASTIPTTSKFACVWNGKIDWSKGYGTKVVTSTSTGTTIMPKPTAPAGTGSSTSTGTITLGTLIINTNFSIDKSAKYNIAEVEAKAVCESTWKKYENDPKSTQLACAWNGKTVFSKIKPSSTSTGSTSTGTMVIPKTPVSTGGTASGVIVPAKPVDVLASITVTVDGRNQPDIYNTYKLNETEAMNYCANLASKVLTTSKFSCIWNGKELGKGFGMKVVTPVNIGSGYYPTTGTGTLPKIPVSTGSTSTGVTNPGVTSTGSIIGALMIYADGQLSSSIGMFTSVTKDEALNICKNTLPNISMTKKVECMWNNTSIFTGLGTKSNLQVYINNKLLTSVNITEKEAAAYCERIKSDTPASQTIFCRWNDTTIYSGNGKQIVTQTNSGSTSSGSTSTGSLK